MPPSATVFVLATMSPRSSAFNPDVVAALVAALLFGASALIAKWFLRDVSPWMLVGLLYLGFGVGLSIYRRLTHAQPATLQPGEAGWRVGAVLIGGVAGPMLLMETPLS